MNFHLERNPFHCLFNKSFEFCDLSGLIYRILKLIVQKYVIFLLFQNDYIRKFNGLLRKIRKAKE